MVYKILVAGPQGSGKGTQAERLSKALGIPALSMGQLLRDEIAGGTELGKQMKDLVDTGRLVPAAMSVQALMARLAKPDVKNGYILDGFPRNMEQLGAFDLSIPTHLIVLNIPREESLRRLTHRLTCDACGTVASELDGKVEGDACACGGRFKKRKDDNAEAIERRLGIYENETRPVLAAFAKRGIVREIDGVGSIPEVSDRVLAALKS